MRSIIALLVLLAATVVEAHPGHMRMPGAVPFGTYRPYYGGYGYYGGYRPYYYQPYGYYGYGAMPYARPYVSFGIGVY